MPDTQPQSPGSRDEPGPAPPRDERGLSGIKALEHMARQVSAYNRSLIEASLDPLVTIGPDGTITDVNAATEQATGRPRQQLIGTDFADYFTEPDRARQGYQQVFREGAVRDYALEIRRSDGHITPVLYNAAVYRDEAGQVVGVFAAARDISERKRAERARQESETAFRLLADSVPQLVWMCRPDGLNIYFNQRWVEYTGLTLEECYGRGWDTPFHPEDKQPAWDAWNRAVATGGDYRIECRLRAADGCYRWFLIKGVPLRDSRGAILKWFGTCTDIDDLKRAEQEVRSLNTELEQRVSERTAAVQRQAALIAAINAAQSEFISSASGRISFDSVLEKLLRLTDSEYGFIDELLCTPDGQMVLSARAITNIAWNDASRKMYDQFINGTLNFTNLKSLYGAVMTSGKPVIANDAPNDPRRTGVPPGHPALRAFLGLPLISSAKEFVGVIGLANRPGGYGEEIITYLEPLVVACANLFAAIRSDDRRKKAERDLRLANEMLDLRVEERTRELAGANRALAASNADLEQFAYVASHDLQEPLRMISSYVELLAQRYQGHLDEKADKFIHYIVDGATRMQTLINDLLTFSRVTTRAKPFTLTSAEAALADVLTNLGRTIAEKEATVTHDPLPDVMADPSQFEQVLQNLIGNGLKFCQQKPRVHVRAERRGGEWVFAVRDNGIGIAPEHVGRLFVIFQRLHTRADYPGTGIGLAVCKKVVERHGGRIWVESQPGQGSTFFFTIPACGDTTP